MATMTDLEELAIALPQTTREVSDDGRPSYLVHGKMFCFHRGRRPDAIDPETGERLDDVLMFRVADEGVKELLLADDRGAFFTNSAFRRLFRRFDAYSRSGSHRPGRVTRPGGRGLADEGTEAPGEGLARRAPARDS